MIGNLVTSFNDMKVTATGGTIVTSGGYKYHTFTSNGTFAITGGSLSCEILQVAGGAGGGYGIGGGGGAGGLKYTSASLSGSLSVVIGAGGAGGVTNVAPGICSFSKSGNTGSNTQRQCGCCGGCVAPELNTPPMFTTWLAFWAHLSHGLDTSHSIFSKPASLYRFTVA
jgi:hypothetical protein